MIVLATLVASALRPAAASVLTLSRQVMPRARNTMAPPWCFGAFARNQLLTSRPTARRSSANRLLRRMLPCSTQYHDGLTYPASMPRRSDEVLRAQVLEKAGLALSEAKNALTMTTQLRRVE